MVKHGQSFGLCQAETGEVQEIAMYPMYSMYPTSNWGMYPTERLHGRPILELPNYFPLTIGCCRWVSFQDFRMRKAQQSSRLKRSRDIHAVCILIWYKCIHIYMYVHLHIYGHDRIQYKTKQYNTRPYNTMYYTTLYKMSS